MNKKFVGLITSLIALMTLLPFSAAVDVGTGIGVDIETEDFVPEVWMCGTRIVWDDDVEPGRVHCDEDDEQCREWLEECNEFSSYEVCREELLERLNNYAFEGESIKWDVLVMDKNGIEKIEDVFVTIGSTQGTGNDIEANCVLDSVLTDEDDIDKECNVRLDQDDWPKVNDNTWAYYTCIFTVEDPESMSGEHFVTVEVCDLDGECSIMDENDFWFLNPEIALTVDGDLTFDEVRPGTLAYSETILVGNDAEEGSGVMLDMFISGTDFYDSSSSGAKCPLSNVLKLGDGDSDCDYSQDENPNNDDPFCYFASQGAYSTLDDGRRDVEGYVGIDHGDHFDSSFYFNNEIIMSGGLPGGYSRGNLLSPGSEIALTFRLALPEPCNGDFDAGSIYFWGEAI